MTPEEIQALVKDTVKTSLAGAFEDSFSTLRSYIDDSLLPLQGKLTELEDLATAPPSKGKGKGKEVVDPAEEALATRLAALEKQLSEAKDREAKARFSSKLNGLVSAEDPLQSDMVRELLTNRYSGLVEKDGEYYSTKGESLPELVKGFFASPDGLLFKRSQSKPGLGDNPAGDKPAGSDKEISLEAMLSSWV